jgi:hypothetical protein
MSTTDIVLLKEIIEAGIYGIVLIPVAIGLGKLLNAWR